MASTDKTTQTARRDHSDAQNGPQKPPNAPQGPQVPEQPHAPSGGSPETQDEAPTPDASTPDRRSARQRVADLLWWSVPGSTDEEAKTRANQLLDAFAAEVRTEAAEAVMPRTERSHWVDIAAALNAANAAGMPVGIDLDGTLTDHRAWSVVWDRNTDQWTVTGYEDGDETRVESGTRPCGHDDYHDPHEWADRPGVWCPGHSFDEAVQA